MIAAAQTEATQLQEEQAGQQRLQGDLDPEQRDETEVQAEIDVRHAPSPATFAAQVSELGESVGDLTFIASDSHLLSLFQGQCILHGVMLCRAEQPTRGRGAVCTNRLSSVRYANAGAVGIWPLRDFKEEAGAGDGFDMERPVDEGNGCAGAGRGCRRSTSRRRPHPGRRYVATRLSTHLRQYQRGADLQLSIRA